METPFDIAFPILHGKNGEDGTMQGLLEVAGIPSVGCGTLSSALCMDKDRAHKLVELEGIKVPASVAFTKEDTMENIRIQTSRLIYPLFVKPVKSGSSLGITKIDQENQLEEAVSFAFLHDDQIVVEENIDGFEVGCAVLGNDELTIGEIDEIELTEGFFDFYEKYNLKSSKIHMPARIDTEISRRIKEAAASIYRALGCKGFARVDMFLTPEKELVFNEVNTIPGFTSHSRYPNMMKGIGLEFPDVLDKLIQMGLDS
jgi:D-alanine---D-serine ligase